MKIAKLLTLLFASCWLSLAAQAEVATSDLIFDKTKATVKTRFAPPSGYRWVDEIPGSFADFLTAFPLHPPGFPIRDHRGIPISHQNNHAALLNIDVGKKDLQQCADAWIRLYSEYLWGSDRADEAGFEFTDGTFFSWNDYRQGIRTLQTGRKVTLTNSNAKDNSYSAFRNFLDVIFMYAGTISLDRESHPVQSDPEIRPGDFLITPGSPGHLVMIVGSAQNAAGKRLYLLAESFMPAQDIHILVNHQNAQISPWYELHVNATETVTAKYVFKPSVIKRFRALWKSN